MFGVLRRERDGAGERGTIEFLDGTVPSGKANKLNNIEVGCFVYVYNIRRWYHTTRVKKILEQSEKRIRFETKNSTYVFEIKGD